MPCRYVIDKERRLVISTGWDCLTFAEAKAHDDQLLSDPDFSPEFNQLIDATAVGAMDMSIDEAKMLARRVIVSPRSRRAFVATNPAIFAMGRLVGTYDEIARKQEQTGVFYDRDAAWRWLGLEALPDPTKAEEARKTKAVKATKNDKVVSWRMPVARESRRSTRVRLKILIEVQGVIEPLTCEGETIVVNLHGALILTAVGLRVGMEVSVHVQVTDRVAPAEVVYVDPDQPRHCGINLQKPGNIWGVSLPPDDWHDYVA